MNSLNVQQNYTYLNSKTRDKRNHTFCDWDFHGSLASSCFMLYGIPRRHEASDSSVASGLTQRSWDSCVVREDCCQGNHWALMPMRSGAQWSAQDTTAAANTLRRKSVPCEVMIDSELLVYYLLLLCFIEKQLFISLGLQQGNQKHLVQMAATALQRGIST